MLKAVIINDAPPCSSFLPSIDDTKPREAACETPPPPAATRAYVTLLSSKISMMAMVT
jgi:hypothetical protein